MPNPYRFPCWLSAVITILLTGFHIDGWWLSALTTLTLVVVVLVTDHNNTKKENDLAAEH